MQLVSLGTAGDSHLTRHQISRLVISSRAERFRTLTLGLGTVSPAAIDLPGGLALPGPGANALGGTLLVLGLLLLCWLSALLLRSVRLVQIVQLFLKVSAFLLVRQRRVPKNTLELVLALGVLPALGFFVPPPQCSHV